MDPAVVITYTWFVTIHFVYLRQIGRVDQAPVGLAYEISHLVTGNTFEALAQINEVLRFQLHNPQH